MRASATARIEGALLVALLLGAGALGWGWWGGYHALHFAPVTVATALLVATLVFVGGRSPATLPLPALAAVGAALGLATWTAASAAWADDRHVALEEAARTSLYALAVLATALLVRSARSLQLTALAVVVIPSCIALATTLQLSATWETSFRDGRLLGSVGYFNAQAAFLLIPVIVAVGLAALPGMAPLLRALLLGAAALDLQVAILTQSRGAMLALVIAALAQIAIGPCRWRLAAGHGLLVLGTMLAWPHLGAVFDTLQRDAPPEAVIDQAVATIIAAAIATTLATWMAAGLLRLVPAPPRLVVGVRRAALLLIATALAALVLVGARHAPTHAQGAGSFAQRIATPPPDGSDGAGSRFTMASANGRLVLWHVALDEARTHPLTGIGAGNYPASYYRLRSADVGYVRQPHNLALEVLAERGIVGAALLGSMFAATALAGMRLLRGHDPRARSAASALLAATLFWMLHAQLEWLWQVPAVTLPIMCAMGGVLALGGPGRRPGRAQRAASALVVGAASLVVVAGAGVLWLAWAHVAVGQRTADDTRALAMLDRARHLAPSSAEFQRRFADRAFEAGLRRRADVALARSLALDPQGWATLGHAARVAEARGDDEEALRLWRRAERRNPLQPEIRLAIERATRRSAPATSTQAEPSM